MTIFPLLKTQRLVLAQLQVEHLDDLVKHANNRLVSDQIVNLPHPYTHVNASMRLGYVSEGFKEKSRYCFAIVNQKTQEFMGEISLHLRDRSQQTAELGYWIGESFWNQGYMNEAVETILQFGLNTVKYQSIYATCQPNNEASKKILLKNGLTLCEEKPSLLTFQIVNEHSYER